jgi:hypothetical protein
VTPAVSALQRVAGHGEILFAPAMFPFASTNLWYGLDDIGSYDAVGLRWHDMLYERVFGVSRSIDEAMPACMAGLQLFGVQTVMGGSGTFSAGTPPALAPAGAIAGFPYYRVPGDGEVSLVGQSIAVAGDGTALRMAASCGLDPDTEVLLDGPAFRPADDRPAGPVRGARLVGQRARIVERRPGELIVDSAAAGPSWLVVRQNWAPGWTATVDGRRSSVQRVDVAFQGVRLAVGRHRVVLVYRPSALTAGTAVSLASIVAGLLVAAAALGDGRRRHHHPGTSAAGLEPAVERR